MSRLLLFLSTLVFASSLAVASAPLMSLSSQLLKPDRFPAGENVKDLRFSEEENMEDQSIAEPVSAIPKLVKLESSEDPKKVSFGKVRFAATKAIADQNFQLLSDKMKENFSGTRKDRLEKWAAQNKINSVADPDYLAKPKEILSRSKKSDRSRAVATDREGIYRGSEFIFYSMCKHIDSYEKSNEIDLGTSICPGK